MKSRSEIEALELILSTSDFQPLAGLHLRAP
jgi:hypothetical protein